MDVIVPGKDFTAAIFKRCKGIRANGYIACIFQFLTTLLELLQVGYSVFFLLAILRFFFYVILNVMEERRVAIYARPLFSFLSVKLGLFIVLVGTKRDWDQR